MSNSETKAKSQAAQHLKADTDFMDFVEEVRNDQIDLFANSAANDVAVREEAHAMLRALKLIQGRIDAAITAEKFLDKKLKG